MAGSISVRIQPLTAVKASGQKAHDLRMSGQVPGYVDKTRSEQNSTIITPPDPLLTRQQIEAGREKAGQPKLRHDARLHISGIITFSHLAQPTIEAMTNQEQDALFLTIAKNIQAQTGHNLIGLVIHRDESTPHAHFTLRNYRTAPDGSERPSRFTRSDLRKLQDIAAKSVAHLGISRGTPKEERIKNGEDRSKTEHRKVNELHAEEARDYAKLCDERDKVKAEIENYKQLREKAQRDADRIAESKSSEANAKLQKKQKLMETYDRRIENKQAEIDTLEKKADALRPTMPKLQFKKSIMGGEKITITKPQLTDLERQNALYLDQQTQQDRDFYRQKTEELQAELNAIHQQKKQWNNDQQTAKILQLQNAELKKQLEIVSNQVKVLHEQLNQQSENANNVRNEQVAQTGFFRP